MSSLFIILILGCSRTVRKPCNLLSEVACWRNRLSFGCLSYNAKQAKLITDQLQWLWGDELIMRIVPVMPGERRVPLHCRRFAYGYALDNAEFPCCVLWPQRTVDQILSSGLVFERVLYPLSEHAFFAHKIYSTVSRILVFAMRQCICFNC